LLAALLAAPSSAVAPRSWLELSLRGGSVESPASWLDGGFGRLELGEGAGEEAEPLALGEAALGLDWQGGDGFGAHLHARLRAAPHGGGEALGLVEAWVEGVRGLRDGRDQLRLRGGQLFLPTSRENVRPLWSSPYTFTLSAINSWIGEEVRPLGALAEYEVGSAAPSSWRGGASAFLGNDTAGALLAWRGWTLGDRLAVLGETLPLPPLPSLAPGGIFAGQQDTGTTPLGADLDGRVGHAQWLRWRRAAATTPVVALAQVSRVDTRGDRRLHDGEYAWDTEFLLLAAELRVADRWTVAGEHLAGSTAMGVPSPRADVDLRATYALLSWERLPWRVSMRWDRFATRDRDGVAGGERNDEDGEAWTVALFRRLDERLLLGAELVDLDVERALATGPTGQREEGGRALTLGVRYQLGRNAARP
jgi:hypothetical protein